MGTWKDFRSDTVTMPTKQMREAMKLATVGDDVYEDDPTVAELESYAAKLVGKEASLFVPTGTFGNQLSLYTHCNRGDEVIVADDSHIVTHEAGAAAVIAGVQLRTLTTVRGMMDLDKIENTIRKDEDIHFPKTSLICLENAHSDGFVISPEYMAKVRELADLYKIPIHLDGARIFNAAVSQGVDATEFTKQVDSVMFCLSKGLCAPIGSIIAGNKEFIQQARKKRKLLGGGMRQVGIIAAAGLIALQEMINYLEVDHENAKHLAKGLAQIPEIDILGAQRDINMVFCTIAGVDNSRLVEKLKEHRIKVNAPEDGVWRFVTHNDVSREDVEDFVNRLNVLIPQLSHEDLEVQRSHEQTSYDQLTQPTHETADLTKTTVIGEAEAVTTNSSIYSDPTNLKTDIFIDDKESVNLLEELASTAFASNPKTSSLNRDDIQIKEQELRRLSSAKKPAKLLRYRIIK